MALDFNKSQDHPHDELIEDARMAASNEWEENFVASIIERRKKYGLRFTLSELQFQTLKDIAETQDEGDLFHWKR